MPPGTAAALTRAERAAQTRSDRLAEAADEVERLEARVRASSAACARAARATAG